MKRSTGGSFIPPTALITSLPSTLLLEPGQVADEVADLLLAEEQALHVVGRPRDEGVVDVDDREARLGELLRHLADRSPWAKPTPITRSYPSRASVVMFGM